MGLKEDFDHVALQEKELKLPRFDAKVAWDLGTRLHTLAVERSLVIAIDVRRFGQPSVLCRARRHHSRQRRVGSPQEQRGPALPSQLARRQSARADKKLHNPRAPGPADSGLRIRRRFVPHPRRRRRRRRQHNSLRPLRPRRSRVGGRGTVRALLGRQYAGLRLPAE